MLMKVPEGSGSALLCHAKEGVLSGPSDGIVLPTLQDVAELTYIGFIMLAEPGMERFRHHCAMLHAHLRLCLISLFKPWQAKVWQGMKGNQRGKAASMQLPGNKKLLPPGWRGRCHLTVLCWMLSHCHRPRSGPSPRNHPRRS